MKKHVKLFCATIILGCLMRSMLTQLPLTAWLWMYVSTVVAAGTLAIITYYEEFK